MTRKNAASQKKPLNSENALHYMMLTPFLILFFLFTVLPVLSSLGLSFFAYDMISFPKFNGITNYLRMFNGDEVFKKAVVNTLKFAVVTGPLSYLLAYLLAWFINEFNPAVRTVLTFIFYAPAMIGNTVFIWQVIFSADSYGYANSFLISSGLISEPISWFRNEAYNFIILAVIQLWTSMGISFLADIAGLQNVNPELYEAGALDGIKNRWYELWYITLPSMKSILLFGAVMQIQATFSIGSVITSLAGYPSINNSVDTVVSHLLDVGTVRYEMGYAAAISTVLFLMMILARALIGKILNYLGK